MGEDSSVGSQHGFGFQVGQLLAAWADEEVVGALYWHGSGFESRRTNRKGELYQE